MFLFFKFQSSPNPILASFEMFPTFFLSFSFNRKERNRERERKRRRRNEHSKREKNMSIIGPRYAMSPNSLNQLSVDVPLVYKQRIAIISSLFFLFSFFRTKRKHLCLLHKEVISYPIPQSLTHKPSAIKEHLTQ